MLQPAHPSLDGHQIKRTPIKAPKMAKWAGWSGGCATLISDVHEWLSQAMQTACKLLTRPVKPGLVITPHSQAEWANPHEWRMITIVCVFVCVFQKVV